MVTVVTEMIQRWVAVPVVRPAAPRVAMVPIYRASHRLLGPAAVVGVVTEVSIVDRYQP